jgi:hypothetical protein
MIESIQRHDSSAVLGLVCHDEETKEIAEKWVDESVKVIELNELEEFRPRLKALKLDRPKLEHIYSLSPYVVKYFFEAYKPQSVTYVDADLFFYKSVGDVVQEAEACDAGIVGHRFKAKMKHLEKFGIYNVGLVHFNNTTGGQKILDFWLDACSKSTSTNASEEVFGDQKYLDKFSAIGKVHIFHSAGVNAAPWNCDYICASSSGELQIETEPLQFFHFSGLKIFRFYSSLSYTYYEWEPTKSIKELIFIPYIRNLLTLEKRMYGRPIYDERKISLRQLFQFIENRDLVIN